MIAELIEAASRENIDSPDFLGMLMTARDKDTGAAMSERELIDEVMTLVVAGHETTASGLNWTWYLISQYPEVEKRLHAELDAIPDQPAASLSQMESLSYTHQVIDEALRLYPPGWLLSRRAIGPDTLSGYEIPAGTDVFLSPTSSTATRGTGRNRTRSAPSASTRNTRPSGRVLRTCPLPQGHATASAKRSRSTRC